MKATVEHEVTRKLVIEALLERHRLTNPGGPVPRPSGKREALAWVRGAVRSHGLNLWASVEDASARAVTEAVEIAEELFPELT